MTQTNPFGKVSELSLVLAPGKMRHLSFTAPFKVLHPFHQDGFLQIMVVKVSAGLMAGDRQSIAIDLEPGTKAEFLSQSYEKIHQMAGGEAVREGRVTVGRDATLFYAPLPVLPFADSAFRSAFAIELADETSRLFYSDILACGRTAPPAGSALPIASIVPACTSHRAAPCSTPTISALPRRRTVQTARALPSMRDTRISATTSSATSPCVRKRCVLISSRYSIRMTARQA